MHTRPDHEQPRCRLEAPDGVPPDFRELAARADLDYVAPVTRSEEGMPIGTGSMGSLVWTTPTAIRMQVNRVDVFASNKDTRSFRDSQEDYCNGCAYVDINLVDFGDEVFAGPDFRQHLSVYDGVVSITGNGVSARAVASQQRDVFAIEIEDRRARPSAVGVDLRMLRYAIRFIAGQNWDLTRQHAVQIGTDDHTATSRLDIRSDRIVLTQEFREGDYYCASAVVAAVAGRSATARYASESAVRLSAAPGEGKFTIMLASAASFDPKEDVVAKAMAQFDGAGADFAAVHAVNEAFWGDFWSRSFIRLQSTDGRAEFVERHYTYFLYLTASCSRGAYPPKFNGMLWVTTGDMRLWGACYWWDNMSPHCRPLPAMNRPELLEPFFRMYGGMAESCALAARQQWGSQGLYYPITVHFDGMAELPEDIAEEMRDLYLRRKPWEQRSRRFMEYAEDRHGAEARWNWKAHLPHNPYIAGVRTEAGFGQDYPKYLTARRTDDGWTFTDKGGGTFGHVTHAFGGAAEMALVYWKHYEHTQDREWLRQVGYPIIKGVVEFYRNFPNMKKGEDGRYHLHGLTGGESLSGAQDDPVIDMAALHTVTPILIRAAQILGTDPDLLPVWHEFLDHLPALQDAMESRHDGYDDLLYTEACWDFSYVESEDAEWMRRGGETLDRLYPDGTAVPGRDDACTRVAIAAAHLGRPDDFRNVILNQCRPAHHNLCGETGSTDLLPNHMSWRSGPGAPDAEHLGFAAEALQEALLQSGPPAPGQDPIIHVFPAWPKDWEAEFTLGARGGFLVSSAMRDGKIPFIELQAVAAVECRLRNPWGEAAVALIRDGRPAGELAGSLLRFPVAKDEVVVVRPGCAVASAHDTADLQGREEIARRQWRESLAAGGKPMALIKEDWETVKTRCAHWWANELYDRALVMVKAPKQGSAGQVCPYPGAVTLETPWIDADYLIWQKENEIETTYYGGEYTPFFFFNSPVAGPLFMGCEPRFTAETLWADPLPVGTDGYPPIGFHREGRYWRLISEGTRRAAQASRGAWYVHPSIDYAGDTLAGIRGVNDLMIDIVENPAWVRQAVKQLSSILIDISGELWTSVDEGITGLEGSVSGCGVWSPGRGAALACDTAVNLSPGQFEDLFLPSLIEYMATVDYRCWHMDGYVQHLDLLLALPDLQAIQWYPPDAFAPNGKGILPWIPLLKRIQRAGKAVQVYCKPEEIPALLEELSARGLCICTHGACASEQEARDLVALMARLSRER